MSRTALILKGITKEMRGIEVAPWFAPLTPKRQGFNCLVLDISDGESLSRRAKADPNVPKDKIGAIEDVDLVGSATEIADLIPPGDCGAFDYIISSHNFEHLPNPIKFLQGCEKVLRVGGVLSMAVPDARACFDVFRPHTTIMDWLSAYHENRKKPSRDDVFEAHASYSVLRRDSQDFHAFSIRDDLKNIAITGNLGAAYQTWLGATDADPYCDAHCSVMTPSSFELLITECRYLGLTSLECDNISGPQGAEFYVRLVNRPAVEFAGDINGIRTQLSRRIWNERAMTAAPRPAQTFRKRMSVKYFHPLKKALKGFLRPKGK